jgi:hypothetical protein
VVTTMGYERQAEDDKALQPKDNESGVDSQIDSPGPQSAEEVSKSAQAETSQEVFCGKEKTASSPGTEYWLP